MALTWPPEKIVAKEVPKMKIRMLITHTTALDGNHVLTYEAGKEYELPEDVAKRWASKGMAESDKMAPGPSEMKDDREAVILINEVVDLVKKARAKKK